MEQSEIGKICLRCMNISDDKDICPFCNHEKKGQLTWSKALAPGTILNHKILIGNIQGKGGYGITYIGYDMLLEYPVAVKEFFPDEMVDRAPDGKTVLVLDAIQKDEYDSETRSYLQEARVLAEFSKFPGIVAIKDMFYENNTGYLIMEYLQGGNLRSYIDDHRGFLPVEDALHLMEPVVSILVKLHRSGLIHRDISPDNIMMDDDGSVKLIDFGGSRKLGLTTTPVFLGKWGYAPLEQMLSKSSEQGPWTDVYGVCATLYDMMTGVLPQSSYERSEKDELVDIRDFSNLNVEPQVARAIMRGLSMEIGARQQSMDELFHELYGRYPDEQGPVVTSREPESYILKDRNERVWFGHYPMNEVVGAQLTSDIVYAEYNKDNVATVDGEKYLRLPVYQEKTESSNLHLMNLIRAKYHGMEISGYRYFMFNMLSWRVVQNRGGRVTLMTEYIIDYKPFDELRYLTMTDKDVMKVRSGIYWERSKVREWLNSVFVRRSFTDEERQKLNVTKISTPVSALSDRTTYDKVYLPSIEEIRYGFDIDHTLIRGVGVRRDLDMAPCSQFVDALAAGAFDHSSYGLRSRGPIDHDGSYKCAENAEGHRMVDNEFVPWLLNQPTGLRPVICVNETEIMEIL